MLLKKLSVVMCILSFLIALFYIMLPHIQEKKQELSFKKEAELFFANEEYLEKWENDDWRDE